MGLPSWAWGRQRGPGPLKSCQMGLLGNPLVTKAILPTPQAPWWPVGETTLTTADQNGEVFGGTYLDPRANSPHPEVQGLSNEGESCGGASASVQHVLLSPVSGSRALCDCSKENGYEEGKIVMEIAASMFPLPSQEGDREAVKTGTNPEPREVVTQNLLPEQWQPHSIETTAGAGVQESQETWVGHLGVDRQEKENEVEVVDSRAAEKGEAQDPFSIPPSPFLRPWVYQPEDSTKKYSAGEKGEAEDPFSISPSPFLRPWVYWPGDDTQEEQQQGGRLGAADRTTQASTSLPGSSQNVCTFFRGEDTDEEEEEEQEDSDAGETEGPFPLPSAPLNTHVACPGKDWGEAGEYGEKDETEERKDGDLGSREGHPSVPSTLLRNWMYWPGEEEDDSEATDSRPRASQETWSPARSRPEHRDFQVTFYLPGEKPPPPWEPPRPPLWLWLRLQCIKPCAPPPEPVMPVKDRKVRFSEKVTVHLLAVWAGPARAARRGPWEQMARDRSRFARRIAQAQKDLGPCLTAVARARARARLRKLEASHPTLTLNTSSDPLLATPLSPAVAPPSNSPSCV